MTAGCHYTVDGVIIAYDTLLFEIKKLKVSEEFENKNEISMEQRTYSFSTATGIGI